MSIPVEVLAGLIGGGAMLVALYAARMMMPEKMRMDLLEMLGTMFVPAGSLAYGIGLLIHAMMSIAFAVVYGAVLEGVGATSLASGTGIGLAIGLVHAFIAGALLAVVPMMRPRMRTQQFETAFAHLGGSSASDVMIEAPGAYASNYPAATTWGFLALHLMFGALVGLTYGAFA